MNKIRVGFDIGHGKDTYPPSKGIGDFAEWEFNNAVVKYAIPLAEYNDFEVLLTQPLDSDVVNLTQRINNINAEHKKNPIKLLMSFHADYNDNLNAKGHWCFYWHTSTNGKRLAEIWMKYADEILSNPSRGLMQSKLNEWTNFAINRDTLMPTALMEHAFYSNVDDLKLLKSDEFRKQCAIVAVKTICEYCGVEFKEMKEEIKSQQTKQGKILATALNIRQSNSTTANIVGKLNKNDVVTILEEKDGWYRINNNLGWISGGNGKYVEIIEEKMVEKVEEKVIEKVVTSTPTEVQYPTIQRGSKGEFVLILQKKLQELGYTLIADGIFGIGTDRLVKQFQGVYKLTQDGVVGMATWNRLMSAKKTDISVIEETKNYEIEYMNNYINIVKIPKDKLKKIDVVLCKQPKETLMSVYNRLNPKPSFVLNGGLFAMNNGNSMSSMYDEGKKIVDGYFSDFGLYVKNDGSFGFGNHKQITDIRDFIGASPTIIIDGKINIDLKGLTKDKNFTDSRHPRTCIGMDDKYLYLVVVDGRQVGKVGMTVNELSNLGIKLGLKQFLNLDGGGSARLLGLNGKVINSPTENRAVDNCIAFYVQG